MRTFISYRGHLDIVLPDLASGLHVRSSEAVAAAEMGEGGGRVTL
jgi:hypothetical protein